MTRQQKLHRRLRVELLELEELIDKLKAAGPCELDGPNALQNVRERLHGLAGRCECHWLPPRPADASGIVHPPRIFHPPRIVHPTGSDRFAAELLAAGRPAPWHEHPEEPGALADAFGDDVLQVDVNRELTTEQARQLAVWIEVAVNTLAGFRVVSAGAVGEGEGRC